MSPRVLVLVADQQLTRLVTGALSGLAELEQHAELDSELAQRLERAEWQAVVCHGLVRQDGGPPAALACGIPLLLLSERPGPELDGVEYLRLPANAAALRRSLQRLLAEPPSEWERALGRLALAPWQLRHVRRLDATGVPVLLVGEPGCGRQLLARMLAARRQPPDRQWLRLDELPPEPAELERLLTEAASRCLFIPRLGLWGTELQQRLAQRLLDPLRAPRLLASIEADDCEAALARLAPELADRLQAGCVHLPPLREDPERTLRAATNWLFELGSRHGLGRLELEPDAAEWIRDQGWPRNLLQLWATLESASLRAPGPRLSLSELQPDMAPSQPHGEPVRDTGAAAGDQLDELAEALGHELKNPLVSIKTFTQLLPDRLEDQEFRQQYMRIVLADVDRIDATLDGLLEYTRLSQPRSRRCELGELLPRVTEPLDFLARKHEIELTLLPPEQPLWVYSDPELLGYALTQVLHEALASVGEHGRIELLAHARSDAICVQLTQLPEAGAERPRPRPAGEPTPRLMLGLRLLLARGVLERMGARLEVVDTRHGVAQCSVLLPRGSV